MADSDWRKPAAAVPLDDDNWSIEYEYRVVAGRVEVRVTGLHYSIRDFVKDEVEREALLGRLVRGFFEAHILK
ncbi:MAG TPA: hypothetical protein VMJ74_13140 [Pseudomonadales bacterium]|nr:hypothetical protein [Pseudomonadales bacterium]